VKKTGTIFLLQLLLLAGISATHAGVLPEERVDVLYHSYDGGGVQINGPSVLVRKGIGTSVSTFYNFYIDNISSASIDVELGGSPYAEERTEQTLGVDYLRGKTTMKLSYTDSAENDYNAGTVSFGISQDFFGDLTTLDMGYSYGSDDVSVRGDPTPLSSIARNNYRVSLSQILTKNATIAVAWETITDEATTYDGVLTLGNPYRSYSFRDPGDPDIRSFAQEKYPKTRTSNALAIRGAYFLEPRSAIHAEARFYQDSWGIDAFNYSMSYVKPIGDYIFDFRYRHYAQSKANFYRDLFDYADQFDFMARDKELSTFTNTSFGMSASYEFAKNGWGWIDKGSLNLSYDHLMIRYEDYRDARESVKYGTATAGNESLYKLDADVIQAFISIWY